MSTRRIVAREFAFYSAGFAFMQAVTVAVAVFVRNALGPEQMGLWVSLQAILLYTKYSNLGLAGAAGREIPYERGRGDASRADRIRNASLSFTLATSGALSGVLVAAALPAGARFGERMAVSLVTLAALSFFQRASTFCVAMARAEKRFTFMSRFNVYSSLANAAFTVLFVTWWDLYGYYASMVLSYASNLALILAFSGVRFRLEWDVKALAPLLRMGLVLIAAGMAGTFLQSADKLAAGAFLGLEALGYYSLALMAVNLLTSFPNNLSVILFPYQNEVFGASGRPEDIRRFLVEPSAFLSAYLPAAAALGAAAAPFVVSRLMPAYLPGVPALEIALFGGLFTVLYGNMADALITLKRYRRLVPMPLAAGGVIVAGVWAASKTGSGVTGVAWAAFAGYAALYAAAAFAAMTNLMPAREAASRIAAAMAPTAYLLALTLALDAFVPGVDARSLGVRLAAVAVALAPVLWFAEKRFRTSRLVVDALSRKGRAVPLAAAAS